MHFYTFEKNDLLNIEDYYTDDGKFEITHYFRDLHKKSLERLDPNELLCNSNQKGTKTLFHGTTTAYLNDILQKGLLPRQATNIDNWADIQSSASNVVYLTNKWHYFYAYRATTIYLEQQAKKEGIEPKPWWLTWDSVPCYIECEVPKALLVPDEDFFHSQYVSQKIQSAIKKQKPEIEITWEESLAHYATVGVVGGIPPQYIKSFTILGELELQQELMHEKSPYQKDLIKWGAGKGKGSVKLIDLIKREDRSLKNGTWFLSQIPKNAVIEQIGINPKSNTIAIVFQPIKNEQHQLS